VRACVEGGDLERLITTFSWHRFSAISLCILVLFLISVEVSEFSNLFGRVPLKNTFSRAIPAMQIFGLLRDRPVLPPRFTDVTQHRAERSDHGHVYQIPRSASLAISSAAASATPGALGELPPETE